METYNDQGQLTETGIQKLIMKWVAFQPKIRDLVLHIPNQGKRSLAAGAAYKAMGMRAGVSDLFIAYPNGPYHGAWIELKTKKGKLSVYQKEFMDLMSKQNYFTAVCYGYQEAVDTISKYCALR